MKRLTTLLTILTFTIASANQAPPPSMLDADTSPTQVTTDVPVEQPTSLPQPKEPKNRTSLYVFLGTLVSATVGLLASTSNTGRHATQAEKDSKTGNIPAP